MASPRTPATVLSTGSVASEVAHLFRTKRVSEIRAFENQIRQESLDKSDSLRDLLGTRYKDLLNAADEMTAIRDASVTHVRDALRDMATEAADLRDHFQRLATAAPAPVVDDLERRRGVHEIGARLKHIVDSPEVLYACLESGDVYDAAVRFWRAAANYKAITETSGLEGVANRFADRRWRQVAGFKSQILSAAEKRLVTPDLSSDAYARVLATLILLSDEHDVVSVLDGMLATRTGWVDDSHRDAKGVAESMSAVALVVRSTVACVADVMWQDGVEALLRDVDPTAAKRVAARRADGSLTAAVVSWIRGVKAWLDDHGPGILSEAKSSRALADTLRAIDDVFMGEEWVDECRRALSRPPGFVFDIFKPFISARAGVVASEAIERAVDKVLLDIDGVWADVDVGMHAGRLMWSIVSNQAVGLTRKTRDLAEGDVEMGRVLWSNGQVSTVLGTFESSLQEALTDVTVLTQRVPTVSEAFDKSVRSSLPRILESLRKKLDSLPDAVRAEPDPKEEPCEHQMERSLFVARAATALGTAECVRLAYCFSIAEDQNCGNNASLTKFRQTAIDLSSSGYATWASRLCVRLKRQLLSDLVSEKALGVPMGWTSGGNDNETSRNAVRDGQNALRYPTTASTAMVNFIIGACRVSNSAGGFALPTQAILYLRNEMTTAAVETYDSALRLYTDASESEGSREDRGQLQTSETSDPAVMQMLFDVLTLQECFGLGTPGHKLSTKSGLKSLEAKIQASVDPIDLAACRKAMQESVLSYATRTGILFGTINRGGSDTLALSRRPVSSSSLSTSSNLVSLSSPVPRFTYLPAPMPSTYSATVGGTAGLNAKAAIGLLRTEATATNGSSYRRREADTSVAGYASKVSESVGRFGRGFFESLTRKVG